MRLNKYLALATGLSRRAADAAITDQRVRVNNEFAMLGQDIQPGDQITLDGQAVTPEAQTTIIILNKPAGYVCSRDGQGSKTIYDLLPEKYHRLKPVGRLDKESSGLLLLTNNGELAHQLTHPSFQKEKIYEIQLDHSLSEYDFRKITQDGIILEDGPSTLRLDRMKDDTHWRITMTEGRNRQIRRTFAALGYNITRLHRTHFGPYHLDNLPKAEWRKS